MDPHHIYRPLLDLFGLSEGTDAPKGRGYNETLNYGAYSAGPVSLVRMTLDQVDALQTRMLRHPENYLKSSAVGRYQIVRTTLRGIRKQLHLSGNELFDAAMQDRMACFLLGRRGIDRYIAGAMDESDIINELAKEWASVPTTAGKGHYDGQKAAVTVDQVRSVLHAVRARATGDRPAPVPAPRPQPDDPGVEASAPPVEPISHSKRFWTWLTTGGGTALMPFVDWRVQFLIVTVVAGLAIYAIATMPAVRQKLGLSA